MGSYLITAPVSTSTIKPGQTKMFSIEIVLKVDCSEKLRSAYPGIRRVTVFDANPGLRSGTVVGVRPISRPSIRMSAPGGSELIVTLSEVPENSVAQPERAKKMSPAPIRKRVVVSIIVALGLDV
jgi:hypothetical protein